MFIVCICIAFCSLSIGLYWNVTEYEQGKLYNTISGMVVQVYKHGLILSSEQGRYFVPTYEKFNRGDVLNVKNYTLQSVRGTRNTYLLKDRVFYTLDGKVNRSSDVQITPDVGSLVYQLYQRTLGPPYDGLVMGFLFGGDELIPEQYQEMFRTTGTSHILVVSGFNVAFMIMLMGMLIKRLTFRKGLRFIFSLLAIFGYLTLTGVEASILRASVITILFLTSYFLSRHTTFMNALLMLLTGIAIYNPHMMLYNIGLQLSVVATIGIVYSALVIEFFLEPIKNKILSGLLEAIGISLVAYLVTFPIIHYYFHASMIISPIINLFIAPLIPLVMVGGLLLLPLSLLQPFALLAQYVIISILKVLIGIVEFSSHQTQFIFHYQFTLINLITYYLLLTTFYFLILCLQNHKNKKYFLPQSR